MRRSGACPAAHMGLFWQFPGSIQGGGRTKTFPLGGRWPGEAGSDEGHSVEATTSARKPTFPPLISQKSKIFASFPRGGSLFLVQVRGVLFCCIRLGTYRRSSSGSPGGEPPSPGGGFGAVELWGCAAKNARGRRGHAPALRMYVIFLQTIELYRIGCPPELVVHCQGNRLVTDCGGTAHCLLPLYSVSNRVTP